MSVEQKRTNHTPLPAGFCIALRPSTRRFDSDRLLLGVSPVRILRFTDRGATAIGAWGRGEPVGPEAWRGRLARRLVDAGIADPVPCGVVPTRRDVAVVIPVRDRPVSLGRLLGALGVVAEICVVDDGSRDSAATAIVCESAGAKLVRHSRPMGPAGARNTGIGATEAPFIAFVDSDCLPLDHWLERLLAHLADPAVAAAAPRIVALEPERRGVLAAHETRHSPLDMGPRPGAVRPRSTFPFVPGTALLTRRSALGVGFDAGMLLGEDIDFVWRLAKAGWTVRYVPEATVAHEHRVTPKEWLATRIRYGRSAAQIAQRHPRDLAPLQCGLVPLTPWPVGVASVRAGFAAAVVAAGAITVRLGRRGVPAAVGARVGVTIVASAGRRAAHAMRREWWPMTALVGATCPKTRKVIALALLLALERPNKRRPWAALLDAGVQLVDGMAYGVGVWLGCIEHRTIDPLVPAVSVRGTRRR